MNFEIAIALCPDILGLIAGNTCLCLLRGVCRGLHSAISRVDHRGFDKLIQAVIAHWKKIVDASMEIVDDIAQHACFLGETKSTNGIYGFLYGRIHTCEKYTGMCGHPGYNKSPRYCEMSASQIYNLRFANEVCPVAYCLPPGNLSWTNYSHGMFARIPKVTGRELAQANPEPRNVIWLNLSAESLKYLFDSGVDLRKVYNKIWTVTYIISQKDQIKHLLDMLHVYFEACGKPSDYIKSDLLYKHLNV